MAALALGQAESGMAGAGGARSGGAGSGGDAGHRRRRTAMPAGSAVDAAVVPMSEMNTTPLIDVMLVLLIMFIITVPVSTHAVKLDLPSGPPPTHAVNPVVNTLGIDGAGALRWNGAIVTRTELAGLLATSAAMPDEPELHLVPDADAPYATVDSVLADAKRADIHRMGFVGNQEYAGAF